MVTFDVIDTQYTTELLLNFDYDSHSVYNDGMANLKYETKNAVLNLGGLFVFILIRAIMLALIPLSYFFKRYFAYCLRKHTNIENTIFDKI